MRNDVLWVLDDRGVFTLFESRRVVEAGQFTDQLIGQNIFDVFKNNPGAVEVARRGLAGISTDTTVDLEGITWEIKGFPLRNEIGVVSGVVGVANDVTDLSLFEFKQRSVFDVMKALREALAYSEMLPIILDQTKRLFNPDGIVLAVCENSNGKLVLEAANGIWASLAIGSEIQVKEVWHPNGSRLLTTVDKVPEMLVTKRPYSTTGLSLTVQEKRIGVLWIAHRRPIRDHENQLLVEFGEIIANAVYRARNYGQTQLRLKRLAALHEIDQAITSNTDLKITFNIILYHVLIQLGMDAAVILLLNPSTQKLEYSCGRGFRTPEIKSASVPIEDCFVNQKTFTNEFSVCTNMLESENSCLVKTLVNREEFECHFGVPLVIRGQIKGVLGLFHRTKSNPENEWFSFLETIATQSAIAVDNMALFTDLQLSNQELTLAYETTLEGWVRALDLRDKETEGHTKRVAEMTLKLAQAVGVNQASLPHIRRGALLHDIGKMGISDKILNKIGSLSEDEWVIMRRHPVYAKNLLSPITFLHQSIDIPYYHHEKWDGTGYPQGLIGEEIPLAARIFAIVDVWDALTSDRPYRPAWSPEKSRSYIQNESGRYFDPRIVNKFFELGLDQPKT